jgi:acylphosphatase
MILLCLVIDGLYSDARAVQTESAKTVNRAILSRAGVAPVLRGVDNTTVNQSLSRKQAVYTGRVQGVGFRATVAFVARGFPVTGWVRNDASGSVTLQAQGADEAVESFLEAVQTRQASFIATTSVKELPSEPAEAGFRIAR